MDRRKAMIGYAVYAAGKPFAKRALKARSTRKGSAVSGKRRIPKKAIVASAVGAVGAVAFWRRRRSKGGSDQIDQAQPLES